MRNNIIDSGELQKKLHEDGCAGRFNLFDPKGLGEAIDWYTRALSARRKLIRSSVTGLGRWSLGSGSAARKRAPSE